MEFKAYDISCPPKPRQTRRSKYKKTPSDERYYRFKDEIKRLGVTVPDSGFHVLFVKEMPVSWTLKKKKKMLHRPHESTPDLDNLEKALFDSLFKNDSHIWDCRCSKVWGKEDKLIIITGIETGWINVFLDEVL